MKLEELKDLEKKEWSEENIKYQLYKNDKFILANANKIKYNNLFDFF